MAKVFQIILILSMCISCNSKDILKYKKRKFFTEKNVISKNEENVLFQQICYDKPKVTDDGYCHNLKITILDLDKAQRMKIIDLKKDTSIAKCEYGMFSIWDWSSEKNEITGTIEIQNWEEEEIKLKENILVNDLKRKQKKVYKGQRIFIKRNDLNF